MTDLEGNSPHQEGVIQKVYHRPAKSYFQELPELQSRVDTGKLVQKVLHKQADLDKCMINNAKKNSEGNACTPQKKKETALLAFLETWTDKIISYHSSLFAGHQSVISTYLTVGDKFFMPTLIHNLRSYIKGYHLCQLSRNEKNP